MVNYDLPTDLLQMRRDFVAAEERLSAIGKSMPSPVAVAAKEAEISDEQRQEWWAAQDECRRLAEEIQRHAWWASVDNRQQAWTALHRAAAAGGERDDLDKVG